ncbi:hypothetical protein Taro_023152 [Colocasia esculenta]|uniref:Uncharacterized protein n=1 Tax=Colocasia esculenta TaxID=4460 RepID=A0A843VAK0_COLES|nr:hypothetical protein [Colocasia esculenta]
MKRNYSAFAEDIPPYSGPKAARETYADLKQLSAIPGISTCARSSKSSPANGDSQRHHGWYLCSSYYRPRLLVT